MTTKNMAMNKILSPVSRIDASNTGSENLAVPDLTAETAVRDLLLWIGEDPTREGLRETPQRLVRAWREMFRGYQEDPREHLCTTFEDVAEYNGVITLQNIRVESCCEHHLLPFVGEAFIAYIPNGKVAGLSKLARVLDGYAKRMQIQERLTAQVAHAINDVLQPVGVAVAVRAEHCCLAMRGAQKPGAQMLTTQYLGSYATQEDLRRDFMAVVNNGSGK